MAGYLQQLENNEAVLLMYLAGELPAEDRVEVEHMLKRDPSLRATLADLQKTQDGVLATLQRCDAASPLANADLVARRVARAMRQRQVEVLARPDYEPVAKPSERSPWWVYPIAAAALVVLGYLAWLGIVDSASVPTIVSNNPPPTSQVIALAPDVPAVATESSPQLAAAEEQLSELRGGGVLDFPLDAP